MIGADVHKSTHALAAVNAGTGQLLGEREIPATERGHLDALRWAHEFGQEIVWAVEPPWESRLRGHDQRFW
jgi:transposase